MRYRVDMQFEVTDQHAAELNAQVLGEGTHPDISGGFTTDIEADSPSDALAEAFARGQRFTA